MEGTIDWTAMEHGCFVIGSEERGYVMYGVEFDDTITDMYETLFYFYLYLLMIINW